ncbi:mitochondrial intermembrane space import and assembly protein 40-B [Lycorma delicatula]|uniref:mitochondrial intermembrane space import and assembly protein 40-B n=1 Tax=Lycorma delicatula TaxID=130591 RepID=UPI003F50D659
MSYCRKDGKDVIIFATEEDHKEPSNISLPEPEPQPGLILSDGSINWNCPCLGGMATGPCGVEFREAFSCFHYSKEDPKGSECFESFRKMQTCMAKYPTLYNTPDDEEEDEFRSEFGSADLKNQMLESGKSNDNKIEASSSDANSSDSNIRINSVNVSKNIGNE